MEFQHPGPSHFNGHDEIKAPEPNRKKGMVPKELQRQASFTWDFGESGEDEKPPETKAGVDKRRGSIRGSRPSLRSIDENSQL